MQHGRPEAAMSVYAFLRVKYRIPLRIRLEMRGLTEGAVEGLMRKHCRRITQQRIQLDANVESPILKANAGLLSFQCGNGRCVYT